MTAVETWIAPGAARRCCDRCGCVLARDNRGSKCAPCGRARVLDLVGDGPALPAHLSPAEVRTAWREGGLPRLAEVAGDDLVGAADLAWDSGLVPRTWRLSRTGLVAIASRPEAPHVALAHHLGVSRWAIAGWRTRLGLVPRGTTRSVVNNRRDVAESRGSLGAGDRGATTDDLRLRVLGAVELVGPDGPMSLGAAAERVIVLLALRHPEPVRVEDVAEAIYPDELPDRARRALHSAVWRLRRQLPDGTLTTADGAYSLGLPPDRIDVIELDRCARAGRAALLAGRFDEAAGLCGQAVALWRGPPASAATGLPGAEPRIQGLASARDGAVEDWAEATMRAGRAREVVGSLTALTDDQPLRERAWALLLDAHRSCHQWTDVAETAARAIAAVADVGVEPGPELAAAIDRATTGEVRAPTTPRRRDVPGWLRTAVDQGPFVGRHDERDSLLEAVERAGRGRAGLVLVSGEAGVGKTRLVAEVAVLAAGRGFQVWGGRCDAYRAVPFGALLTTIRHLMGEIDAAKAADLVDGPLRSLLAATPNGARARPDAAGEQFALFDAVADLMGTALAEAPAVLVVDDVHWASQGTLLLLRQLLRTGPDLPLAVLATMRDTEAPEPGAAALLTELARLPGSRSVPVEGLTARDVAAHPDLVTDREDRMVVAERIRALTGGNALLVTEALALGSGEVSTTDRLARTELSLTMGLAIDTHVAGLDEPARRILTLAAVGGHEIEPSLLRDASARPPLELDAATVNSALDAAERAGTILGTAGGAYEFRHDLLRYALVDGLATIERASLHLALADALADRSGADRAPLLYLLAFHLDGAGAVVDPARVLEVARRAASLATRNLDFMSAARYYDMAAGAARRSGSADQVDLLIESAASWRCAAQLDEAMARVDEAIGLARQNGWRLALARAVTARGELELQLTGRLAERTLELVDLAAALLAGDDGPLADRLRYLAVVTDHGAGVAGTGDLAGALEPTGDDEAAAEVMARAFWEAGPANRPALAERLRGAAHRSATARATALALLTDWLARIEQGDGRIDEPVAAEIDTLVDTAGGDADLVWTRDAWWAGRDLAAGRLREAARSIDEAYRKALGAELPTGRIAHVFAAYRGHQFILSALTRQPQRALQMVGAFERLSAADPLQWDRIVASSLVLAGRVEEARPLYEETCDAVLDAGRVTPCPLVALVMPARISQAFGDRTRAEALLAALLPWRGHQALIRNIQAGGSVDAAVGHVHVALGDLDAAVEAYTASREQDRRQGVHTWATSVGVDLVETLLIRDETGDRATAEHLAADLAPAADAFGMTRARSRLERALAGAPRSVSGGGGGS